MENKNLTEKEYWDQYWQKYSLPLEVSKSIDNPFLIEILNTFDRYLPYDKSQSILEIGGSPGQYLAYMHKTYGYKISCLDFSSIGCAKTLENYELLQIKGTVYQTDLFSEDLRLPLFDIVYSLGFIEHFSDTNLVIEKHLNLTKPGGILFLGVPNFSGVNHFFLKRLAPHLLSKHNLAVMDLNNWISFEKKFNLQTIYKGYIGGFQPSNFNRCEKMSTINFLLLTLARLFVFIFRRRFKGLRKINSKYISGYMLGFYKKPV
jgi:SAM-dependent methyltransferase